MKKVLVIICCLFIGACSRNSYRAVMNVETSTLHSWSLNYKYLDGIKTKKMTVEDGEIGVFKVNIISEDGTLDFKITSLDGTDAYVGKDIPTSTFEVTVDKSGTYELTVEAHDHEGSLTVDLLEE